ncbi:hypothetical protein QEG73_14930 [Chitinophagaceae bacterium 26-R-25]|nr:hypothetical protein [Chitinophagaceae bacterium 26-R-25]
MILLFAGCWASASLFTSHIFDEARWISLPVGIVWALLVTNLYLLLLYTISPELLPVARKKIIKEKGRKKKVVEGEEKVKKGFVFSFSFLFRTGLITFLGIVLAQPFNVSLFAHNYEEGDRFAEAIKHILSTNPGSWFITVAVCVAMLLPIQFKYRIRKISQKNFEKDFEGNDVTKGIRRLREQLGYTTDPENLYKQILSFDINSIRTSDFYFQKSLIQYRIILEEYEQFKKTYSFLLTERNIQGNRHCWENLMPHLNTLERINPKKYQIIYGQLKENLKAEKSAFEKYEYWADHPFRTKRRVTTRKFAAEKDLLQTFYKENN